MNQQTLVPYKAITKLFILSRQVVESRAHRESQAPAHRARNQNLPALPPNFRPHPEW